MKRQNRFSLLGIGLLTLCLMFGTGPATADIVDNGAGSITVTGDNTDPIAAVDDTTVTVNTGATLTTPADAISFTGDNNTVVNNGAITATTGSAILVTYDNDLETTQSQTVTNNGTITGETGISFCTGGIESSVYDDDLNRWIYTYYEHEVANNDVVDNYGTIESTGDGTSWDYAAVKTGGGDDLLNNYEGAEIIGAVRMGPDDDQLFNWGDITGTGGSVIEMGNGDDTLTNYGTITVEESVYCGISTGNGDDIFTNAGTVQIGETGTSSSGAGISMGYGDDVFDNSGTVDIEITNAGGISMADGDDTFTNSSTITMGDIGTGGIVMAEGSDSFTNTGTIRINSTGTGAINLGSDGECEDGDPDADVFDNAGTITIGSAGEGGIGMGSGNDTFTNTGRLTITETLGGGGIHLGGGDDTFDNAGTITMGDINRGGITFGGGDDSFTNAGTITMESTGNAGISMAGGDDTFTNAGTLTMGDIGTAGISIAGNADIFTNTGTITMESTGDAGISMAGGDDTFTNTGTLTMGDIGTSGIVMAGGNDIFDNSGTINMTETGDGGIVMAGGDDTFTNTGRIRIGDTGTNGINMAGGNDVFDNAGTIRINSTGYPGISMGPGLDRFTNSGTILIVETGTEDDDYGPGINLGADDDTCEYNDDNIFENTGTITITDAGTNGIGFGYYGDDTFNNTGTITITNADNNGINMGCYGDDTFTNAGTITITEAGFNGIHMGGGDSSTTGDGGRDIFINSGTITIGTTGQLGIHAGDGPGTFDNTGTIIIAGVAGEYANDGGIGLAGGNDRMTNAGTIEIGYLGASAEDYAVTVDLPEASETTYIGQAYKGIIMGSGNDKLINTGAIRIGYMGAPAVDEAALARAGLTEESDGGPYSGIIGGDGGDLLDNSGTIEIVKTDRHGIIMGDGWDTIKNTGTITIGETGYGAIGLSDGDDTFDNSGTVTIGASGYAGISMADGNDTFTNSGMIDIGETGLEESDGTGISLAGGNDAFDNTGTIVIHKTYNSGISLGDYADTFVNDGTIRIQKTLWGAGITLGNGDDIFENNGVIRMANIASEEDEGTTGAAIAMGEGNDIFTNTGELSLGDGFYNMIKGGTGDDTLTNAGTINGGIIMGDGDDTVNLASRSVVTGDIDGKCDDYPTNGYDVITLDGAGYLAGDILRFDILDKTGDGTWTVNGLVTVDDEVNVAAGTLRLNDDLAPHDDGPLTVAIDSGATLTAHGITIDGSVRNQGVFDLGAKLRHSTITGDYTNAADATTAVALFDTGAVTHLTVEGMAVVQGGTLLVTPVGVLQDGSTYTVLTAGTLSGIFDEATANSMVLSFDMDDETVPNSIILETDRRSYAAALADAGLTGNEAAISRGLMQLIGDAPTGRLADLINALDRQPDAASLAAALDQMSPELYTLGTALTGQSTGGFTAGMTGRLSGLRMAATNRATEAGPALAAAPAADRRAGQGWSPWAKAFYTTAEQDTTTGFMGYDYDAMGLSVGIDKGVADNMVVGVTLGAANAEADVAANMGEQDVDTLSVGIYGSWTGDKVYMDGALLFGLNSFDSLRHIPVLGVTARGDHDGYDGSAYIGGGYMAAMGDWNVIPTASMQYTYHEEEGFIETGAGPANLAVDKTDTSSLLGKLGVRLNRLFQVGDGMDLMPEMSLQWGHEFADRDQQAVSWFAGTSTGAFTIDGLEANRDSGILGLSMTAFMGDSLSLSAGYEGTMKEEFEAHTFTAGLRYMF